MKKLFQIVIVSVMCLSLFGCHSKTNTSEEIETTGNEEISENDVQEDLDKKSIIAFYDTICDAYEASEPGSGKSVNEIVENTRSVIEDFMKLKPEETQYADYINKIQTHPMLLSYIDGFLNNVNEVDFDYYLTSTSYMMLLHDDLGYIIQEKLPFEYDRQTQYPNDKNEGGEDLSYSEVKSQMIDYINKMTQNKVPIQDFNFYYSYPESKYSRYNIENVDADYYMTIGFSDLENYGVSICIDLYNYGIEPYQVMFSSGDDEVIIYSSQIDSLDIDYIFSNIQIYNSQYTDSVNSNYEKIEKMFMENDNISINIDDTVVIELTEEDIVNTRAWFSLFDILCTYLKR